MTQYASPSLGTVQISPYEGWCDEPGICAADKRQPMSLGDMFFLGSLLGISSWMGATMKAPLSIGTGTGKAPAERMAVVREMGQAGEKMAGIVKNTKRIPSATQTAKYRVPDELNSSALGEVKNVQHLNYTNQLRDFADYARQQGLTFTIYTRPSTTLSSTLKAEINAGRIIHDTTRLGP